jgi:curved DNA-binding protein CbpA
MLFNTTNVRNKIIPTQATFKVLCAILKDRSFPFPLRSSILSAKTKISPTETVTANLRRTNAGRFVLTKLEINGLSSCVPKYMVPTTVVKQSMEPMKINSELAMYFTTKKKQLLSAKKPAKQLFSLEIQDVS